MPKRKTVPPKSSGQVKKTRVGDSGFPPALKSMLTVLFLGIVGLFSARFFFIEGRIPKGIRHAIVPPAKVDLIILGDGQMMQEFLRPSQSWPVLVGRLLRRPTYPIFEIGASPADYAEWIPKVLSYQPKRVVIALDAATDFIETAEKISEEHYLREEQFEAPSRSLEFEKGAKRAILNPDLRLRSVRREDPKVGQGIRLSLEILKEIQKKLIPQNIPLTVVWIPTKESVFAREFLSSGQTVPETYLKLLDEEAKILAKFQDALRDHQIFFLDMLLPLQAAVAREQNPYDFKDHSFLNAVGHREVAEAVARFLVGTEGLDWQTSLSGLPFVSKTPDQADKDFELKLFVAMGALSLGLILFFTKTRSKKRPIFLLALFLATVFFECLNFVEFFPLTAFQMYSFPEEKVANYLKIEVILEDGRPLKVPPHKVLPMLADGRAKRYARDAFLDEEIAHQFTGVFQKAYNKNIRKKGDPGIREIRFEKWKWDFLKDPKDPERGYLVERVVGLSKAGEGHAGT